MEYLSQPAVRIPARARLTSLIALLFVVAACGDDPVSPSTGPGIHFLAGAEVADTVGAVPVQALRVEVRGSDGRPAAGQVVRASGIPRGSGWHEMEVARLDEQHFADSVADTTDTRGIVHFRVRMGPYAGPSRIAVTAPALGLQDTARFEVLPGAIWAVEGLPHDGGVPIDGTLTLAAHAVDRWLNVRNDPITYSVNGPAATVAGNVLNGVSFGEVEVIASAGDGHSQTVTIPVVPDAVVAFQASNPQGIPSIHTVRLDGSNLTTIAVSDAGPSWSGEMVAAWAGPGEVIYSDEVDHQRRSIYRLDLETGERARLLPPGEQMEIEQHPQIGDGGASLFFSGGTSQGYWLYRKPLDGGPIERLSAEDLPLSHRYPAPSPDGALMAYNVQGYGDDPLEIMDLRTGAVRSLAVEGFRVRWSPDGSRIGFMTLHGALRTMGPDGTDVVPLAAGPFDVDAGIDWSPAGDYLVAVDGGRLALAEVASGTVVTVGIPGITGYSGAISSPAWRPESD